MSYGNDVACVSPGIKEGILERLEREYIELKARLIKIEHALTLLKENPKVAETVQALSAVTYF